MEDEGGYLVYKCRRCGEEIRDTHVPDGISILNYLLFGYDVPSHWWRTPLPHKEDIHRCKDGSLGVADLIGFEIDRSESLDVLTDEQIWQKRLEAADFLENLELEE